MNSIRRLACAAKTVFSIKVTAVIVLSLHYNLIDLIMRKATGALMCAFLCSIKLHFQTLQSSSSSEIEDKLLESFLDLYLSFIHVCFTL